MKAFCLMCLNLTRQDWNMGYCREKEHYVHKTHKNCSKYRETPNVKDDPEWMMKWYSMACKLSWDKETLVRDFLKEKSEFKEKGD